MNDDDLGGESACFAHLDVDGRDDAPWTRVDIADVAPEVGGPADGAGGAVWSLPHGGDLDANVVHLGPASSIGDHVNREVDVLLIGAAGTAEVACGDLVTTIRPGVALLLPRGIRRGIRAGVHGVTYFSVHRRRGGLTISDAVVSGPDGRD